MTRPIINTVFTPRVKPTTTLERPREWMCTTWDEATFTWDSTSLTWDEFCTTIIITAFTRPRYASYVEDLTWANVFDLAWNLVEWISGNQVNKIDTVYT